MNDIILVGFGGHGLSVADTIERTGKYHIVGYTDKCEGQSKYPYLGRDDVLQSYYLKGIQNIAIGIGYLGKGRIREDIYFKIKKIGFVMPTIIDPSAIVSDDVLIDEGSFIGKNVVVNAGARIGKMCIINTGAIIEHECVIADFAHIAVSAVLCGSVRVGKGAFVGANATVIQNRNVPDSAIIPAGMTIR